MNNIVLLAKLVIFFLLPFQNQLYASIEPNNNFSHAINLYPKTYAYAWPDQQYFFIRIPRSVQMYCDNEIVNIPDTGLLSVVRTAIKKPEGPIDYEDVKGLTTLVGQNGIQRLTGLEYFTGLDMLILSGNIISDLAPLQNLTSL